MSDLKTEFAKDFENLRVWQNARVFVKEIYETFDSCRDYAFRDQIRRASMSIMNNIAEGFERRNKKDFAHFLDFARSSAGEVKSMLFIAEDLKYLLPAYATDMRERLAVMIRSIGALASKLHKTSKI
jgi:four helix bundle protein